MTRTHIDISDRIMVITMTRTDKRNAIDPDMTAALDEALNAYEDDPEIWCAILTGGPDMFCAGSDMAQGSGTPTARGGIYGTVGRKRKKPLIAAVEGVAFGGGFELTMACDIVVAAETARFGLPEVKRGLVATSGALFRASQVLPLNLAKHLLMTGEEVSPRKLADHGYIQELTPQGKALSAARRIANQICENSPLSVSLTLQTINGIAQSADPSGWEKTGAAQAVIETSEDSREGVAAFFEKRKPKWTGR